MKSVLNTNLNCSDKIKSQPLFLGEDMGLQRYDILKYPIFDQLWKKQMEYIWVPEEIPLKDDRNKFENLTTTQEKVFKKNLSFQTMGDSMFSRSIELIKSNVTNTELEAAMSVWSLSEVIHSRSYSYVLNNISRNPNGFFDEILQDKEILYRASNMREGFDALIGKPENDKDLKEKLFKSILNFQIAEGITFYVSFACSFWFGSQGIMTGNADIIKLIQRDEACVSKDTEVLTEKGWVRFDLLERGVKVAQYNKDGTINFVIPKNIIKKRFDGNLIGLRNKIGQIDMLLTPDHRVIFNHIKTGEIRECLAGKFKPNQEKNIPVAGRLIGEINNITDFDRFLIALQADGSLLPEDNGVGGKRSGEISNCIPVSFFLKKKRKIDRLKDILVKLNFEFTSKENKEKGGENFYIKVPKDLVRTKYFSDWVSLKDKSFNWCVEFIEEVVNWDGHIRKDTGSLYYSSVVEENVSIVQAVALLAGYRTYKYYQDDNRKDSYKRVHRLSILQEKSTVDCQSINKHKYEEEYHDDVYCVSVDSGMFVARRGGGAFVTGNCHQAITQNIITIWKEKEEEGFQDIVRESEQLIYDTFGVAVENEKRWAEYLFADGSLIGLNSQILGQYSEWLANNRLRSLGYKKIFDIDSNPIGGWINQYVDSSKVQTAPQERPITSYKKSAIVSDLDGIEDFKF